MNDLKPWRVTAWDIYAGRTAEEAVQAAMIDKGYTREYFVEITEFDHDAVVLFPDSSGQTTVGVILGGMSGPGRICSEGIDALGKYGLFA